MILPKIPVITYPEVVAESELDRMRSEHAEITARLEFALQVQDTRRRYLNHVREDGFLRKLQFAAEEGILDELLKASRSRVAEIGY